ncbi:flagellar biosynthetic protein FliR [Saliniramus sp.]|uniref:flagellar biosynthetic protein FliR n=1 Tax=Saliniramus sp. TaxID=2986772 RepID=UPI002C48A66F|nr:flagellar biosynthetic protein FliR [Saliniramus sp.]HMB11249.1 flagellar biosynthetic protein FliR [Saliniramus sp.]
MDLLIPQIAVAFLLTFARVGTLVMLLPAIGEQSLGARARLSFALLLTLVMFPATQATLPIGEGGPQLITLLISEIFVGLMLGMATRLIIGALQTAGTIIAQQIGLGFAMAVDPAMGGQQAAIGNFLSLLGITLIFATDLHHLAIAAIRNSYDLLPPGGLPAAGDAAALGVQAAARGFRLAIQISAPFLVFGILFNLGLGVLARLMPQMPVFFLGLPATILLGMVILFAVVGVMMGVFLEDIGDYLAEIAGL